jgi:hypothetical protein
LRLTALPTEYISDQLIETTAAPAAASAELAEDVLDATTAGRRSLSLPTACAAQDLVKDTFYIDHNTTSHAQFVFFFYLLLSSP